MGVRFRYRYRNRSCYPWDRTGNSPSLPAGSQAYSSPPSCCHNFLGWIRGRGRRRSVGKETIEWISTIYLILKGTPHPLVCFNIFGYAQLTPTLLTISLRLASLNLSTTPCFFGAVFLALSTFIDLSSLLDLRRDAEWLMSLHSQVIFWSCLGGRCLLRINSCFDPCSKLCDRKRLSSAIVNQSLCCLTIELQELNLLFIFSLLRSKIFFWENNARAVVAML